MGRNWNLVALEWFLLLALVSSASFADQSDDASAYAPAKFRIDDLSLANQISFPWSHEEGKDFSLSVACTARVTREGRMEYPFCSGGTKESNHFERLIIRAVERARMVPARIGGKRRAVAMKFTAIFGRMNDEASVTVVPNHFLNAEQFGTNYSSPQLLVGRSRLYARSCRGMNVMMKITVDAVGDVSNASLHRGDPKAAGCIRSIKKRLPRLRYLPGVVNGVPTTMEHLYLVGWRGSWTTYGGSRY